MTSPDCFSGKTEEFSMAPVLIFIVSYLGVCVFFVAYLLNRRLQWANDPRHQRKARPTMADERFTFGERRANIVAKSSEPGWHFIRDGRETGPIPLAELVEKAAGGEIGAGDLVKQTGGIWAKARDAGPLQEAFRLRKTKQETLNRLGRFHGIWLSKRSLFIGGSAVVGLIGLLCAV